MIQFYFFLVSLVSSHVINLNNDNMKKILKDNYWVFVEFIDERFPKHAGQIYPFYEVSYFKYVAFASINCSKYLCKPSVQKYQTLKLFKEGEPLKEYENEYNIPKMVEFLESSTSLIWLNDDNYIDIFVDNNEVFIGMVDTTRMTVPLLGMNLLYISLYYCWDCRLCILDVSDPKYRSIVRYFGVTKFPTYGAVYTGKPKIRYLPNSLPFDLSVNEIGVNFFLGELKRHIKMELVPENWNSSNVLVVTYLNYNDVVLSNQNIVVVLIYDPMCRYFTKWLQAFEKLAENYKNNPNIVFAKTDAMKNDYDLSLNEFPNIIMYPKGPKTLEKYRADLKSRNLRDLTAFVELELTKAY